jgi:hypothetical protein
MLPRKAKSPAAKEALGPNRRAWRFRCMWTLTGPEMPQVGKALREELCSFVVPSWSRTQSVIAQSSMEAELLSMVSGLSEGLGIQSLLADFGYTATLKIYSDSSAGRRSCLRVG